MTGTDRRISATEHRPSLSCTTGGARKAVRFLYNASLGLLTAIASFASINGAARAADNPVNAVLPPGSKALHGAAIAGLAAPAAPVGDEPVNASLPQGSKTLRRPGPVGDMEHGVYLDSPIPPINMSARQQTVSPSTDAFSMDGDVAVHVGDEMQMYADHVAGNLDLHELDASGNVMVSELGTNLWADSLKFDSETRDGEIDNATYRHYPYTLNARKITTSAGRTDADDARLTTSPPDIKPLILFKADRFEIDNAHQRIRARNVSFYALGTRLLTLRQFAMPMQAAASGGRNEGFTHQIGVDTVEGFYLGAGAYTTVGNLPVNASGVYSSAGKNQAAISTHYDLRPIPIHPPGDNEVHESSTGPASTVMYMIRDISRIGKYPVPQGDPLRFHDFTAPSPMSALFAGPIRSINSNVSLAAAYDQRIYGAPITYLYVTKFPEVGLHATMPIGAIRPDFPLGVDPDAVRAILHKPEFTISAAATDGYYHEIPTDVSSERRQMTVGVDTRPFLVGDDFLCYAGLNYINNSYDKTQSTLSFPQGTIALQRLFTDLTAIGAQLTIANPVGRTPFDFDTLGANHELDLRGQYGNDAFVAGAVLQYDLQLRELYTAQYSLGPNLHGVIPRVTYDLRSRSVGFATDIVGITY